MTAQLEQTFLLPSRMLSPHSRFYVREMRILAYNQLLQSYRSLTLESMARSFGVSEEFIDKYVFPPFFSLPTPFPILPPFPHLFPPYPSPSQLYFFPRERKKHQP